MPISYDKIIFPIIRRALAEMIEIYQYQFKVGPESIDILKHVNNREYLRWMEKAAMEHATLLGCGAKECLTR